ncbi:hypothetical protein G6F57_006583 [Rhizopus arrhizus]|uniref:Peroxisomal membrane protein PEX13 n=1 Tax=Rhizopus oryzae TaxID=64495 RepID=A0A9P6X9Q6_RHIOR|nr:hypothetical protein G6F23_003434 [Rhizopus arrhizus]KAG1423962.1 hypothetical protein G6F58_002605 [Rhizopus delemar]KAG0767603.1 hypothetical protein G6F24_002640 [Rhizopus arrhizus]KAG0796992.1 hypothetical protein G6F21_000879 [Rhizopus arrhizus]KAG0801038.1 hypothetical protein G6F22_001641 [Rhizopus arrhizus]
MPSPPKPWEVNNNSNSVVAPVTTTQSSMTDINNTTTTAPALPSRPSTMGSNYNAGYGASNYGAGGGYGGMYGSSYSSPYNRYGGYGSYGSYGGYGGYGSYGSSYSPYNRFGGYGYNQFGAGGGMFGEGPENISLAQQMESSTRATFDIIGSIVQAFGGFAQMLDSTYMATHSSFMAMIGVAEQFGNLRHYLGNIFNLFGLLRWLKRLFYKLTGKTPPADLNENKDNPDLPEDQQLQITNSNQHEVQISQSRNRRPVILFLAIITGLPYIMYKLIQRSHEHSLKEQQQRMMIPQYGGPVEMARVIHDFNGENQMELTIRRGDVIQILSKVDPATGLPCDWWQGRLPNGLIGIFPANHVQIESIY